MSAEPTRLHAERPTIDHADIRWRVGQISKKDPHKGSLLGYIDARTCMEALDTLDPEWSAVHGDPIIVGGELVGVPCRVTVNGVTRSDVGMPSSQEPIKGAYSDALKRAAVHFGIGRELYELPRIYVKLDEHKKPVATPTYRNGRWTLPSGAGSVFYDREPEDQPESGARGASERHTQADRAGSTPARSPEEQGLLDQLLALPGMSVARMHLLADAAHVEKGERATADQLRDMLRIAQEPLPEHPGAVSRGAAPKSQPGQAGSDAVSEGTAALADSNAVPAGSVAGTATPAAASLPPGGAPSAAPDEADDSAAQSRMQQAAAGRSSPSMSSPVASTPTDEQLLTAAGPGAEIVPPKPGTDEYRAMPARERASARAYWQRHEAGEQESLAEALGGVTSD